MSSKKKKSSSPRYPNTKQSSPFGIQTSTKGAIAYKPNYFPGQQDILNNSQKNEAGLITGQLPDLTNQYTGALQGYVNNTNKLTADNVVNPEMYNATYRMLSQPVQQQNAKDRLELNNMLTGSGLQGGSYDALQHYYLNQNLGENLGHAADSAYGQGLEATKDYLGLQGNAVNAAGQGIGTVSGLAGQYQNLSGSLQQQLLDPQKQFTPIPMYTPAQTGMGGTIGSIGGAVLGGIGGAFVGMPLQGAALGASLGGGIGNAISPNTAYQQWNPPSLSIPGKGTGTTGTQSNLSNPSSDQYLQATGYIPGGSGGGF